MKSDFSARRAEKPFISVDHVLRAQRAMKISGAYVPGTSKVPGT
ncbi:MAG: hypothetical protein N2439_00595 [Anaerolineae bacterium]|nr:hypothetical protein [Anaerolineae bacterium]